MSPRWPIVVAVSLGLLGPLCPLIPPFLPRPKASSASSEFAPNTAEGAEAVRRFIQSHHQKLTQGDLKGMVADYANQVRFFDKGYVTRDFIFQNDLRYYSQYYFVEQSVVALIHVTWLPNGNCEVTYPVSQRLIPHGDTVVQQSMFQTVKEVSHGPHGFEIVRQSLR